MKYKKGDKVMFEKNCQSATYQRNYYPKYHEVGEIVDICGDEYRVIFDDHKNKWTYLTHDEVILFNDCELIVSYKKGNSMTLNYNGVTFTGFTGTTISSCKPEKQEMEEKEMKNEVLELWYTRKRNKIIKEYEEKEREFYESIELVVKYKTILDVFEQQLKDLYESEENQEQNYIVNTMTSNLYEYNIDYKKLNDEFVEKYISERNERINELNDLKKEIDAQLSLSNDAEYQIDVLIRYGILDKKTKKMVN